MAAQQTLAVTACCRASSRGGFFPGDAASTVSLPLAALLMICSKDHPSATLRQAFSSLRRREMLRHPLTAPQRLSIFPARS